MMEHVSPLTTKSTSCHRHGIPLRFYDFLQKDWIPWIPDTPKKKQFGNWETDKPGPHHFSPYLHELWWRSCVIERSSHCLPLSPANFVRSSLWWFTSSSSVPLQENSTISALTWYLGWGRGRRMEFQGWWRCLFRWWLPVTWVENCTVWLVCFEIAWNMLKHVETCWNHQASEFHAINRSSTIFQMTPRWSDFVTCWCYRSGDQFHDIFLMKNLSLGEEKYLWEHQTPVENQK